MSSAYDSLDPRVRKWVYKQGWPALRPLQESAIPAILARDRDVLISAGTAAGKTEAFFLPACSAIAGITSGFGIVYISPLKALINDQYRRLESLGEALDMPVTPWHGDVPQSKKKKIRTDPAGILLITPESLESLLINSSGWIKQAFSPVSYIVIDEFHAFIGTERGMQLLSLLNRIDHVLGRHANPVPRVALSATLGELDKVPELLRPDKRLPCETVTDSNSTATLQVQVKGYLVPVTQRGEEPQSSAEKYVCADIFRLCRGDSHLVFANSRKRTESIAATLSDMCEENVVPNEFFPHHGSLSRELRETLEARLQQGNLPTTAVCTMTLELGIDIGKVQSVIQVTPPYSVSSLRQRMGRSGRRDSPSVLRMLISEQELTATSDMVDRLRLQLVQSMAMIRLMITKRWFEPADARQMHYSTLLHQILAITAQWGGVRADQLWSQLCQTGPFRNIDLTDFKTLLRHMGGYGLLTQLASGEMVIGAEGEKLTNHYTFYAVFNTPEEFRIVTGSRTLGTVPVDSPLLPDQHIIFGGRRWKVTEIEVEKKVIYVEATKGGQPPQFSGGGMSVHDVVRQEMLAIYRENDYRIAIGSKSVDYADATARSLFAEGCDNFKRFNLQNSHFISDGQRSYVLPWMGDKVVNTITALLIRSSFKASSFAGVIEIDDASVPTVQHALKQMLFSGLPSESELAADVPEKYLDKYDDYLPESLLAKGYGAKAYDIEGTQIWLQKNIL
ncbi:DEAD/DEAH box helicase [Pectobacterium brasiliense]|uniref:DEAD/DEAH box helicase n=1 Tax=Pectobacterium brasiliense TaxID=180957 RepID=A0A433NGQ5_9GAMM|nr:MULTISPECIES: DEAD/DEAH box helicase [Pectobacterium]GKW26933.1 ATP-dependent helicase [Pectobacterium carotovorum subsp. carotovorum]MBN3047789.1 DEAD/DEAH box helicase [Pectobacterium brasiliense]MBN3076725.1 DEAD/DEAH box helicase [Pectobacterium brasiliense]MBN3084201.1 DEAD/DEAH box helicase [Pectobacterium brasiliense]MBN3088464.1 DEAD/DEAH box helicase [Pectobacterium brasiliense]